MTDEPRPDHTLRKAAVRRLLHLKENGNLTAAHLRAVAETFAVHPATVRRWLGNAQAHDGQYTPATRQHLTLTRPMRDALALWCGNIAATWRELVAEGHLTTSYATFHRAVLREYTPGHLAGLRGGEQARRSFDIHPSRRIGHRNQAWEGDHVEASVWVNVAGQRRKPYITWFIDAATNCVCGWAVTPQTPNRTAILRALEHAMVRTPDSPFGGTPTLIRIDRGADFRSPAVALFMGTFGVRCVQMPPRTGEGKGSIEKLNDAVKTMLFPQFPGFTDAPSPRPGGKPDPDEHLLTFEAFTARLQTWIHHWNFEHRLSTKDERRNHTPAELWNADLTPIYDIDPQEAKAASLHAVQGQRLISTSGIRWDNRFYVADWMTGRAGEAVTLRHRLGDFDEIEVYDAANKTHLGPATLANAATPEQRKKIHRSAEREARRLRRDLKRAEKQRKERFATETVPTEPRPLSTLTSEEADAYLRNRPQNGPTERPLPDPRTPHNPSDTWNTTSPTPPGSAEPAPSHPATPAVPSKSWAQNAATTENETDPTDE